MAFEYLKQYSTFQTVVEMDQHVEQHIQQHYFDLTESERAIVFTLASRSLAYPGASHLKAETIANQADVSTKTVYRAVKKLAELGIIEKVPGTKMNGIKGASIYRILPYVPSNVSERGTAQVISNDVVSKQQIENQSSNSFNLFSKTSTIYDVYNNAHAEKEACKEYMNEYQVMLYDFLYSLPVADQLKDELYKLVLASGVDNAQAFHRAKDVIFNIAKDIASGTLTVTQTLRAVFIGAYSKHVERLDKQTYKTLEKPKEEHRERPMPFYNWLNERESNAPAVSNAVDNRFIPNWLDWLV